jgi:DNA repair protein RadC
MNTDCIAALLGGSPSAHAAAQRINERFDPYGFRTATREELLQAGKISPKQATALHSAIALAVELSEPLKPGERFSNSREIFTRYAPRYTAELREHFVVLLLDSKNSLIREVLIAIGSLSTSVVHPREVFRPAVHDGAAAMICFHNHPSGDPAPSHEDRECTERLIRSGKVLGIRILDHIVIGHTDYFSFADAGLMSADETPAAG